MRKNEIDIILEKILAKYEDISDIILTVGRPIEAICSGKFVSVDSDQIPIISLTSFQTEVFALNILQGNTVMIQSLVKSGTCDCSYQFMDLARFRVNIFSQRGSYSIILRIVSTVIPTIEKLKLPNDFYEISQEKHGLVLIAGAMSSGKSSTLAAIINEINEKQHTHIITLEDPIEFDHTHKKALINQRELGLDFDTFENGLRSALRQTPKIILVGEIRDKQTFEIVLTAAETGHLVLSNIHTTDTTHAILRILSMFKKEEESFVRCRLADCLRVIAAQKLVPMVNGGRIAAVEIMKNSIRIHETILHGETDNRNFYDIITESTSAGMQTFDQALSELYAGSMITEETAKNYCSRRTYITKELDQINANKGIVSSLHLEMVKKEKEKEKKTTKEITQETLEETSEKTNIKANDTQTRNQIAFSTRNTLRRGLTMEQIENMENTNKKPNSSSLNLDNLSMEADDK